MRFQSLVPALKGQFPLSRSRSRTPPRVFLQARLSRLVTTVSLGFVLCLTTGPLLAETWPLAVGSRLTFLTLDFQEGRFGRKNENVWSLVVTESSPKRIQGLLREESGILYDLNSPTITSRTISYLRSWHLWDTSMQSTLRS